MAHASSRGRLKVFLGYAAGVGKTFQMLSEAQELHARGVDVVIAYFEPHARPETAALVDGLEAIPRRRMSHRGSTFEEMDTDAVLHRRPSIALVDELAHTNVPGSPRAKRWEDVQVLLDAGIDVFTTMNVQHVESLNDQIWQSAGVRVRETVPDWVLQHADEIVMVDLTPRALLNRLARGVVYPRERVEAALAHFFREPTLVALRELAMRQTAHALEHRQDDREPPAPGAAADATRSADRLLLVIDPSPGSAALIRRGRRVADYLRAECLAVFVSTAADLADLTPAARESVTRQLDFSRGLRIDSRIIEGADEAAAVVAFARLNAVTQIFVTRRREAFVDRVLHRRFVQRLVSLSPDLQVTIVADRSKPRTP